MCSGRVTSTIVTALFASMLMFCVALQSLCGGLTLLILSLKSRVRQDGDPIARRNGIAVRIPRVRIPVQSVTLRGDCFSVLRCLLSWRTCILIIVVLSPLFALRS